MDGEIRRILDLGVEVHMNTRIGRDISFEKLEKDYDAILLAIGAQQGRSLDIPGGDAPNCVSGVGADEVLGHFEERFRGLDEPQAQAEAERCMSCGMCFECDNCVIYCPQDAVLRTPKDQSTMGRYVYTDYDRCIGCHICAEVCPTGYINMGMGA